MADRFRPQQNADNRGACMSWSSRLFLLLGCVCAGAPSWASGPDAVAEVMAATFKITNPTSTATCFVITRPMPGAPGKKDLILVTAAHVLEQMSGEECRLVLREKLADGSHVRKEVQLKIRSGEQHLWVKHPQVDVAALKLDLPAEQAGVRRVALDLGRIVGEAAIKSGALRVADEVWVPCYPAQLEANDAGFPVLRRGTVASFPLTPVHTYQTFLVDYRSFGGDSGAPVLARSSRSPGLLGVLVSDARPLIVGLVIGQHRETTRTVSPGGESTVHRPMGLGIAVHGEFIRETIASIQ
jgi:hypothetical protein